MEPVGFLGREQQRLRGPLNFAARLLDGLAAFGADAQGQILSRLRHALGRFAEDRRAFRQSHLAGGRLKDGPDLGAVIGEKDSLRSRGLHRSPVAGQARFPVVRGIWPLVKVRRLCPGGSAKQPRR